jgi:hypothetical protein
VEDLQRNRGAADLEGAHRPRVCRDDAHGVPADEDVNGLVVEERADELFCSMPLASTVARRARGWLFREMGRSRTG